MVPWGKPRTGCFVFPVMKHPMAISFFYGVQMTEDPYTSPTYLLGEEIKALKAEIDALRMSNELIIAELGLIAEALGVEPSMVAVCAEIERLKLLTP